jgi:hypothetical protein
MSLILQWLQQFPSYFDPNELSPSPQVVTDSIGQIYACYINETPPASGQTSVGGVDISVLKLDANGNVIWYRQQPSFDTSKDDIQPRMCVDPLGNIYVTYSTVGGIASGQSSNKLTDVVVFKMDAHGNTLWVKQSPLFNTKYNDYNPVCVADLTGVYVVYYTQDPDMIDPVPEYVSMFKLNTTGEIAWTKLNGTFNAINGYNVYPVIALDNNGYCYVAYFTYDGTASGQTMTGPSDIVVFKTTATGGNLVWIAQQPTFNTTDYNQYPTITVDDTGQTYVAYYTQGSASGHSNVGEYDIVIFKLDVNGTMIWIQQSAVFDTIKEDISPSITLTQQGLLLITYQTSGTTSGQVHTGISDVVVLVMNTNGQVLEIMQQPSFNTLYDNIGPTIVSDPLGNCIVGYYSIHTPSGIGVESQNLVVFKLENLICVLGQTLVLMVDGSERLIRDLKRGDIVAPHHQIARVRYERISENSLVDLMVFEKGCFGTTPHQQLVTTPNHPIFYKGARRPARCFEGCPHVTTIKRTPVYSLGSLFPTLNDMCLYDLQFDHDGSYIANGVEIQSRSPYSCYDPLPKEMYYDQSLYMEGAGTVWDHLDHPMPYDPRPLSFNLILLKNKHHQYIPQGNSDKVEIIKYQGGTRSVRL